MYYYGYNTGYGYGSPGCYTGCGYPGYGYGGYPGYGGGFGSGAAIVLVLFILLVIIIGSRFIGPVVA
jgi:hypothetical protein